MKEWILKKIDEVGGYTLTIEDFSISLEVKSNYAPSNMWFSGDEKRMVSDVNEIMDDIKNQYRNRIVRSASLWKKYCKTKGFSVFDLYNLCQGVPYSHIKTEFTFKKDFMVFYGNGIDSIVEELEKKHNINILVIKNKVSINLNGSDLVKNYTLQAHLSVNELHTFIALFESVVKKDKKLQDYMLFASENGLGGYCYVAKSYGFGVLHLYNPFFERDAVGLKEKLDTLGIPYVNEFSDKQWIYRFKVSHKSISTQKNKKVA